MRKSDRKKRSAKNKAPTPAPRRRWSFNLRYHLDWLVPTIILALFGTTFSLQAFEIPSGSMENTLLIGERVLVNRAAFGPWDRWAAAWMPYRGVRRGDIIVFKFPPDPSVAYVKRVVGLPGDRLRLVRGHLQRNGQFVDEPYVVHKDARQDPFRDEFPAIPAQAAAPGNLNPNWAESLPRFVRDGWLVVPPGCYFAMGDNRDLSLDSRYWGFVPAQNVLGTPTFVYWSLETSSQDFRADSQLEWATNFVKRIVLFPFRARWERMFLPAR